MAAQGGLKHVSTEPSQLITKRERRRGGAAGRAAALRRAPSDSDCSGETASLSADSGDRAPRPLPPSTSRTNTRGRRRGSEWEVLEGLKDGQRFEKKPEVFNGYLHKKRKWPLKGWHKRFFVIDGGILVYARSPGDVARGRLHGSVDVGLSVISAKARRRRIDIDADDTLYHLRAKTHDALRVWLKVLKAHRLYRQHLLTFGARESAPKIHAPLDELPPTENSSRVSLSNASYTSISTEESESIPKSRIPGAHPKERRIAKANKITPVNIQIENVSGKFRVGNKERITLEIEPYDASSNEKDEINLCSINSMTLRFVSKNDEKLASCESPNISLDTTNNELQMHSTELDVLSLRYPEPFLQSSLICNYSLNSQNGVLSKSCMQSVGENKNVPPETKEKKAPTFFCFSRKKHTDSIVDEHTMKKSRKCTNIYKYRNKSIEPTLSKPLSRCILLGKYKLKVSKKAATDYVTNSNRNNLICNKEIACNAFMLKSKENEVQAKVENSDKITFNEGTTISECDRITEKLIMSVFENHLPQLQPKNLPNDVSKIKAYVNQIVKELYDMKFKDVETNPMKLLFRSLLEYWLRNTSIKHVKEATVDVKSVDKQSNQYFTRDKNMSRITPSVKNKGTQFHGFGTPTRQEPSNVRQISVPDKKVHEKNRKHTFSFEKERKIQELEKLLKNTVYICETVRSNDSRHKDIQITKKLINNIGSKVKDDAVLTESSSLTEVPKLQETINHLLSETSIPPDVAKEFLSAYLDVLLHDSDKSTESISTPNSGFDSNSTTDLCKTDEVPKCEIITEPVQKKISKSVITHHLSKVEEKEEKPTLKSGEQSPIRKTKNVTEPGQQYLNNILDKITTIFSKVNSNFTKQWLGCKSADTNSPVKPMQNSEPSPKDESCDAIKKYSGRCLIQVNEKSNSVLIDLTKYDLEHFALNDEDSQGSKSITIKIKEKQHKIVNEEKNRNLINLQFAKENPLESLESHKCNKINQPWSPPLTNTTADIFDKNVNSNNRPILKTAILNFDFDNEKDVRPYMSSHDASNMLHVLHESEHSIDLSFRSSNFFRDQESTGAKSTFDGDDPHSCFVVSSVKKSSLTTKFQSRKKVRVQELERPGITPDIRTVGCLDWAIYDKIPQKLDEKTILTILENLVELSKDLPTLNKEINTLYLKLRKRYEKVTRTSLTPQGLGLLGKIYQEEIVKSNDVETQYDTNPSTSRNLSPITLDASASPSEDFIGERKCVTDVSVNTHIEINDDETQTEANINYDTTKAKSIVDESGEAGTKEQECSMTGSNIQNESNLKAKSTSQQTFSSCSIVHDTSDKSVASPNWYGNLIAKDYEKCICKTKIGAQKRHSTTKSACGKAKVKENSVTHCTAKKCKKEKRCLKTRQDTNRQNHCSCPKVSTLSQTDKATKRPPKQEFTVYPALVKQILMNSMYKLKICDSSDDLKTIYRCHSVPSFHSGLISPTAAPLRGPQAGFVSGTPGGRLASWIIESGGPLENASRELGQAQLSVQQLRRLLDALELQHQAHHDTDVSLEGASPNVKKDRRKFGLRKKKSNNKCASVELAPTLHIDPSTSHMALSALTAPPSPGGGASSMPNSAASLPIACAAARPQSLPGAESLGGGGPASLTSLTPDHQLREDFTVLAKDLLGSLKTIVATLICERGRLRSAMEATDTTTTGSSAVVAALRTNLSTALQQNSDLRSRLSRIHDTSDLAEISSMGPTAEQMRQFQQSLSYSSSCVSASEFFDAEEHEEDELKNEGDDNNDDEAGVIELDGDSSSEAGSLSSEEGSVSSDNSDGALLSAEPVTLRQNGLESSGESRAVGWTRRDCLPCPRPTPGGPSLWNLLYKNIGKDLSQVSMPVTINEPLNMLQRLCEELEYSELLNAAAECSDAIERMSLIAAFAVSAYASSAHRAASKPFNPLLAETYECERDDRAFRFLAEQVSHHPPISACHAESPRWCFWQEARIKTKFWGKSMEFQPTGRVHVRLLASGDHYSWNKVTTCVHNLFGGQRWVDQYGDMHIVSHGTSITCKLNFVKASSWSTTRHEVRGAVADASSGTRLRLQGRWSEALYAGDPPSARCLWRPGAMPPNHELYYGFTRFAMELNEMEPGMRGRLPHTDTRLRPDQRALEEGDVEAAEQYKYQLEQSQRERRRDSPEHTARWFRKIREGDEETWIFNGEYWKERENGFHDNQAPKIW